MPSCSVRFLGFASALAGAAAMSIVVACSSTDTPGAADSGTSDAATCATPGQATPGPVDTHCTSRGAQSVSAASCTPDAAAAGDDSGSAGDDSGMNMGDDSGGGEACPYGATLFGQEADDDDCKYHVKWTSTPICKGSPGVAFTVTVTQKSDGAPVSGIPDGVRPEVFIPTTLDASCDTQSTHPSPSSVSLAESPRGSGVYAGNVLFDAPGEWTVRFHIHEECSDLLEDSPHGHVAFHVTVP